MSRRSLSGVFTLLWVCCLALGGLSLATALASAAAPPPLKPWQRQAGRWIEQLGDRDYRLRESAEQELHDLGVRVVPLLRTRALGHRDPQIRLAASRLIVQLENDALMAPRRVTLRVKNRSLNEILTELNRQTGYQVQTLNRWARGKEAHYTFDLENVTFWEAVEQICRTAHLVVQQNYGDQVIRLQNAEGSSRFVGHDGAFRFVAQQFQMSRSIDFGVIGARGEMVPARSETLALNFSVFAEPRFPFMNVTEPRLDAAYDNERRSMLPIRDLTPGAPIPGFRTGRYYGGMRQLHAQVSVALRRSSPRATHLKVIRGAVPVTILVSQKPVLVTDRLLEAKGKTFKSDSVSFSFETVEKKNADEFSITVNIARTGHFDPNDYSWSNYIYQRIEVQDAKGAKFQPWGSGVSSMGAGRVRLNLQFRTPIGLPGAKIGPPARFIWTSWTTRQHHIPFEFRDLPLP